MPNLTCLEDQLRRSFDGNAWHGPSVGEVLADVTAAEAAARPIISSHSIWEIVLHQVTWLDVARRRAAGERTERVPDAVDWPASGFGEQGWESARAQLERTHGALREAITRLDPVRLDERVAGRTETVCELVLGALQHDVYHAGQIALLKKAARAANHSKGARDAATV